MPTQDEIDRYRSQGFVPIRGILTPREAAGFYAAATEFMEAHPTLSGTPIFDQFVNVWRDSDAMKALTLHPKLSEVATALAGEPLRLWHDQMLTKKPRNNAATEFHQDQPYWPHASAPHPISAWIALCDVPVEKGCMTFLPGSHRRTDLPAQSLADDRSLFQLAPDLEWSERITVPLKAGDCTFHHGRCAHMATANFTDDPRVAHVVIFMPRTAAYSGAAHVVTDPLGLKIGDPLAGELFPDVGSDRY